MRYCFILLVICALACRKHSSCDPSNESVNAVIIDAGAEAADGCGWMVKIESKFYHPQNLDVQFRENELPVVLSYQNLTDSFHCGVAPIARPSIKILNIRKQ